MIPVGLKGYAEETVTEERTAITAGSGTLPVYATPFMTALMEKAAYTSLEPYLEEGKATVGTSLDIKHVAATPLGETVRAESEVIESDGKRITFKVTVCDNAGVIGEGTHQRAVITAESFMARTQKRADEAKNA